MGKTHGGLLLTIGGRDIGCGPKYWSKKEEVPPECKLQEARVFILVTTFTTGLGTKEHSSAK